MNDRVRVRFAPSNTGPLHVGGARTALFNWLYARNRGGDLILRIEDTDQERSTEESLGDILDGLRYLGLDWDEGPEAGGKFGPYFQSERAEVYRPYVERLIESRAGYRCFCPPERLDEVREGQKKRKESPRYDQRCRGVSPIESDARAAKGEPHTVRLRVPGGATVFPDLIKGERQIDHGEIDDLILVRSNGMPTYNLVAAVDDIAMMITHVIRGDDHFSNTPKQLLILRALGETPPAYGHIPLIMGPDGSKLSKRHGATSVSEYRRLGYPGEALANFLALLGWSYDDKTEIMTREELVERFGLERVKRSSSIFDPKKLDWISGEYIRRLPHEQVVDLILPYLEKAGFVAPGAPPDTRSTVEAVARAAKERIRYGAQAAETMAYLFVDQFEYEPKAEKNLRKSPEAPAWLVAFRGWLSGQAFSDAAALEAGSRRFAEEREIPFGRLVHPTRAALTGSAAGPGLFDIMAILGKERTLARIDRAVSYLKDEVAP